MKSVADVLKDRPTVMPQIDVEESELGNDTKTSETSETDRKELVIEAVLRAMPPRFKDLKPNDRTLDFILESNKSFLLTGNVGAGKTRYLLEVILAYVVRQEMRRLWLDGIPEVKQATVQKHFLTVTDVLRKIKESFDHGGSDRILDHLINTPILFLDDLGAEKASEWVKEQLYNVINERYNWCRPVLITTNLSIQEIAQNYGDRMASRLVEMCDVKKFDGKDYRLKGKL